jgi:hypothetical protein
MSVSYGGDSIVFADGSVNSSGFIGNRNRIINGAMMIDQRNAGASTTPTADQTYVLDRWLTRNGGSAGRFSVIQSSTSAVNFSTSVLLTVTTTAASSGTDIYGLEHRVEGYNIADFNFGTADAKSITISFQVRSSLVGTYCVAIRNSGASRSYVAEFTINTANTFETKTVTIPGCTDGTWDKTNGQGFILNICLGSGSTREGTAGSWQASNIVATSNQVDWINTASATFYLTGVQLERGSTASSFEYRSYGAELALCHRYYVHYGAATNAVSYFATGFGYTTGASISVFQFPVPMRTGPSLSTSGTASHYRWLNGGTFLTCSAVPSLDQTNPFTSDVIFTQSSTTVGFGGMIGANSSTAAYLGFSAEL